jgi:hypothetical protein
MATVLAIALPGTAWAGPAGDPDRPASCDTVDRPITAAIARAGREISAAQQSEGRSRGRFWTGIALIAGGGVLGALSAVEIGDDETGPDDGEDFDESDDGEDSDLNKAMLGGGIAAATLGTVLLMTGGRKPGPAVSLKRGGFSVRQTVRF